jgi:hypothetical protein
MRGKNRTRADRKGVLKHRSGFEEEVTMGLWFEGNDREAKRSGEK